MKIKIIAIGIILIISCGNLHTLAKVNKNIKIAEEDHYYSYDELTDLLIQLKQNFPEIFNYSSLGKTWQERDIWFVKISDNVSIDENEPKILYTGGMHGDEKQGYQVVIFSIVSFLENYTYVNVNQSFTERIRNVVNNSELFFIPMVNPDGCEATTRKNFRSNRCVFGRNLLRGVDIARNSGFKWELQDKYPFRYLRSGFPPIFEKMNVKFPFFDYRSPMGEGCYRGPYPFSEPESMAIKQLVENHSINISIDYHGSTSRGEIFIGWAWTKTPRPDENISYFIAENISKISGYRIGRVSDIALMLGFMGDWLYAEHGILSFTMELPCTRGDNPFLNILHGNGHIFFWKNTPILQMCETQVLVNLYLAEKAMIN